MVWHFIPDLWKDLGAISSFLTKILVFFYSLECIMVVIDGSGINYLLTDLIANFEKNCFSGDFSSWNKIFN